MSESEAKSESSRSWLERLSMALTGEPSSRDELVEVLRASEQRDLLDAEVLSIIEFGKKGNDATDQEHATERRPTREDRIDMGCTHEKPWEPGQHSRSQRLSQYPSHSKPTAGSTPARVLQVMQ